MASLRLHGPLKSQPTNNQVTRTTNAGQSARFRQWLLHTDA